MDAANKDEALRCLKKAKAAASTGQIEKARRLGQKSLKLCQTKECEGTHMKATLVPHGMCLNVLISPPEFLARLSSEGGSRDTQAAPNAASGSDNVRKRHTRSHDADQSEPSGEYTPEQHEAVKRLAPSLLNT